jgi:hypothetical protein
MSEIQPMGFRNVYVLQEIDHGDSRIVGVFEAEGLAEMARKQLEDRLRDDEERYDTGIYHRVTIFQLGKIYG